MNVEEELLKLQDLKYKEFQCKLIPTVDKDKVLGVRIPELRKLAKTITKEKISEEYLKQLPHKYYDENNLHGLVLSELKDYDKVIKELDRFLIYVDNWATCDILSPKIFAKNKDKLIKEIERWVKSGETYTVRFGIEMLMSHYLDEDFDPKYFDMLSKIKSDEYYINMMIAWYFATALAKQWDSTVSIITEQKLDKWVNNKTIQKACESYRITNEQKEFLRKYKITE